VTGRPVLYGIQTIGTRGRFFVHFFQRKITFRGKFRGITRKNDFSKLFSAENSIFPNILGGKFSAKFSAEFSPEKMYGKSAPGVIMPDESSPWRWACLNIWTGSSLIWSDSTRWVYLTPIEQKGVSFYCLSFRRLLRKETWYQRCHIFLGTAYQNGKNVYQMSMKCTKVHKICFMSITCTKCP
jgi:hypothetical protein